MSIACAVKTKKHQKNREASSSSSSMDLNQSESSAVQFQSTVSSPQMHNFMNLHSPILPRGHHFLSTYEESLNQNGHHQKVGGTVEEESLQSRVVQLQRQNLQLFWHQQILEIDQLSDFRQHQLPLARIKRIMKSDEDVKMISADAPVLFSKACELFILELTLRSWLNTEENRRRTLQKVDIAKAINRGEVLDFLVDIVPLDHDKDIEEGERSQGGSDQTAHHSNGVMNFVVVDPGQFHRDLNGEFMAGEDETPEEEFEHSSPPDDISYSSHF